MPPVRIQGLGKLYRLAWRAIMCSDAATRRHDTSGGDKRAAAAGCLSHPVPGGAVCPSRRA